MHFFNNKTEQKIEVCIYTYGNSFD